MKKQIVDITPCNLYNRKSCKLSIPPGHFICKKCGGVGGFVRNVSFRNGSITFVKCHNCKGNGYVDWIRNTRPTYINNRRGIFLHNDYYERTLVYIKFKCPVLAGKKCKKLTRFASKQMGAN